MTPQWTVRSFVKLYLNCPAVEGAILYQFRSRGRWPLKELAIERNGAIDCSSLFNWWKVSLQFYSSGDLASALLTEVSDLVSHESLPVRFRRIGRLSKLPCKNCRERERDTHTETVATVIDLRSIFEKESSSQRSLAWPRFFFFFFFFSPVLILNVLYFVVLEKPVRFAALKSAQQVTSLRLVISTQLNAVTLSHTHGTEMASGTPGTRTLGSSWSCRWYDRLDRQLIRSKSINSLRIHRCGIIGHGRCYHHGNGCNLSNSQPPS